MKKYIVTYSERTMGHIPKARYIAREMSADEIEDIKKHNLTILSVIELPSLKESGKCQICHKRFVIGDTVLHMHKLEENEITFIENETVVALSKYGNDNIKYIVHKADIDIEVINNYHDGLRSWDKGMNICRSIESKYFKAAYKY